MHYGIAQDTIVAIATAPGEGAIAIVRLSGPQALQIARDLFRSTAPQKLEHQRASPGWIIDEQGRDLDQVVAVAFHGPASFTGEDIVEFHTHGGWILPKQVLHRLIRGGARMALPGEFSSRAVLNRKLDLVQAEAIQALIGAKNERATRVAQAQLGGQLSRRLREMMNRLYDLSGILEAWVDFPEEDLEFASFEEVADALTESRSQLEHLLDTYQAGRKIQQGLRICLAGVPNVGKSSLMNALLGRDRAIVTEIAGTTRDLLESDWMVAGLHVTLTDTAGVRETEEIIEAEGIRRSRRAMEESDVVLLILDLTRELTEEEHALTAQLDPKKTIIVWNKKDRCLGHHPGRSGGCNPPAGCGAEPRITIPPGFAYQVELSAKTQEGIADLRALLERKIMDESPGLDEEVLLTGERHVQIVTEANRCLGQVIEGLQQKLSAEYVALDMRAALHTLSGLTGDHVTESVLDAIFSRFCLGK